MIVLPDSTMNMICQGLQHRRRAAGLSSDCQGLVTKRVHNQVMLQSNHESSWVILDYSAGPSWRYLESWRSFLLIVVGGGNIGKPSRSSQVPLPSQQIRGSWSIDFIEGPLHLKVRTFRTSHLHSDKFDDSFLTFLYWKLDFRHSFRWLNMNSPSTVRIYHSWGNPETGTSKQTATPGTRPVLLDICLHWHMFLASIDFSIDMMW